MNRVKITDKGCGCGRPHTNIYYLTDEELKMWREIWDKSEIVSTEVVEDA